MYTKSMNEFSIAMVDGDFAMGRSAGTILKSCGFHFTQFYCWDDYSAKNEPPDLLLIQASTTTATRLASWLDKQKEACIHVMIYGPYQRLTKALELLDNGADFYERTPVLEQTQWESVATKLQQIQKIWNALPKNFLFKPNEIFAIKEGAFAVLSLDGRITRVSRKWVKNGLLREDDIQKLPQSLVPLAPDILQKEKGEAVYFSYSIPGSKQEECILRWQKTNSEILLEAINDAPRKKIMETLDLVLNLADQTQNEMMLVMDNHGHIRESNSLARWFLTYRYDELSHLRWDDLFVDKHPCWDEVVSDLWQRQVWRGELKAKLRDGREAFVDLIVQNRELHGENAIVVLMRDISDWRKIQEDLLQTQERFKQIAENTTEVFWIMSLDRKQVFYISPAVQTVWGYNPEDVVAQPSILFYGVSRDDQQRILQESAAMDALGDREYRIRHRSGVEKWIRERVFPIKNIQGQPYRLAGIVADITRFKDAARLTQIQQEQIIQADKLVSLGILVSGVAHEINNPNNVIRLNIDMIDRLQQTLYELDLPNSLPGLQGMHPEEFLAELIRLTGGIRESSERITRIVGTLKDFARKDLAEEFQVFSLNEVVEKAMHIVEPIVKRHTRHFSMNLQAKLPNVRGSFQKLEQVFINLLINACQSLASLEKKIIVSTGTVEDDGAVYLRIQDEGCGIASKDMAFIMDPFFTTKQKHGGTGLGLFIVYDIVQKHGGKFVVESSVGTGTTAQVQFPIERKTHGS
jgi:PAS domain S-box-containing protein